MKSQKKIFRLFSRLNVGGPALHVVNLAAGLQAKGYETTLVVGLPDASEGSMEYYAHEKGVDLLTLKSFRTSISPLNDFITVVKLFQLFRKERPDIVHTHTFKAGLLGRLAAILARVPTKVHTYHGHLLTGYANGYKIKILIFIEKMLGLFTNRLITVSEQVAHDLSVAKIASREKFAVVELGFDIPRLMSEIKMEPQLRQQLNIPADAKVAGIVGRLVPIKSVDLFLNALAPLLKIEKNLHLVIIGDGKERHALEEIARSYDANLDRIHFTGWRKPAARDLRDLDVCVCSSKNEGTSVAIIEAIIAGVPVVSTNVGGMHDLLDNGKWGTLIDYDAIKLKEAVQSVIDGSIDGEQLKNASNYFIERFSSERLYNEIDNLYQNIFDEQKNEAYPLKQVSRAKSIV